MILEKTVELIKQIFRYQRMFPPRIHRIIIGSKYTGVEVASMGFGMLVGLAYSLPSILRKIERLNNRIHNNKYNQ